MGLDRDPWQDLVAIQTASPPVVFCLETALSLHDLSDVAPNAVWLSIPRGMRRPVIPWVATEFVTVAPDLWELGVEPLSVGSGTLRVTSVARTLVDCFRFRRRVGLETAIQALKEALKARRASPNDILEMARPFRQDRVMRPYLEAIG